MYIHIKMKIVFLSFSVSLTLSLYLDIASALSYTRHLCIDFHHVNIRHQRCVPGKAMVKKYLVSRVVYQVLLMVPVVVWGEEINQLLSKVYKNFSTFDFVF